MLKIYLNYFHFILAIKVVPRSIRHDKNNPDCASKTPLEIPEQIPNGKTIDVV